MSTYFLAKVMCDLIPLRLIPLIFLSVIVYFMIGKLLQDLSFYLSLCFLLSFFHAALQIEVDKFFIFFLTLFLTSVASTSIAFWVSAGVNVTAIANLLIALSFVFQMVRYYYVNFLSVPHFICLCFYWNPGTVYFLVIV